MVEVFHDGEPVAWARPRLSRSSRKRFTEDKHRDAKESLEYAFLRAGKIRFAKSDPLAVSISFSFLKPARDRHKPSLSDRDRHKPTKPDIDNLIKLVLDAGNGTLWHDDNQVSSLVAEKVFGDRAFTYICVKGI